MTNQEVAEGYVVKFNGDKDGPRNGLLCVSLAPMPVENLRPLEPWGHRDRGVPAEEVLKALPGTLYELSRQTGFGLSTVGVTLSNLRRAGKVHSTRGAPHTRTVYVAGGGNPK